MGCSQAGPGDERDQVARRVADAVESLVSCWFAAAEDVTPHLPVRQLLALRTIQRRPELNLTALAEDLDVGLPTASRLCDRLETAGLLERSVQPHNRREIRLVVTARGRRLLADVTEHRVLRMAAVFATMTPGQCAALEQGLFAFHAHADTGPTAVG
ncbi:MarR family winged helix-turn-helix transcriptional regulator [Streptomyces sp. NPDC002306]